jgi:hypothetical protein
MTTTTRTSGMTTTATITKASGTTRVHPESASQTILSRLWNTPLEARRLPTPNSNLTSSSTSNACGTPKSKHSAKECYNLHRAFGAKPLNKDDKKKGKEKEDEDNLNGDKYHDVSKVVNIIFNSNSSFPTKRS